MYSIKMLEWYIKENAIVLAIVYNVVGKLFTECVSSANTCIHTSIYSFLPTQPLLDYLPLGLYQKH